MAPENGFPTDTTKREFLRKTAYIVPAVLTLAATPTLAAAGSSSKGRFVVRKTKKVKNPKGKNTKKAKIVRVVKVVQVKLSPNSR
ncbi:MAG TPA: hypothetical protein VNO23_18950 [Candidatus Binatia bacterium]|nr:hypothetical protein [Candidatus Binatia bacterium]